MSYRTFFLAIAALVGPSIARADAIDDVLAQVMAQRTAYATVESLTTEVGPRPAGSDRMNRALDWGERALKAAGLVNVHREPFGLTGWTRGAESAEVTAPVPMALTIVGLGRTVPTPKGGIEAEIVHFARYADLLAAAPGSLAGKIAVVTQRMPRTDDGRGYGFSIAMRVAGPVEAAKRGAVAYLLRSLGTDTHRIAHTGLTRSVPDVTAIPAAALSNPDADQLERLAARGPVRVRLSLQSTSDPQAKSANVVGEIPGSTKPEQIVVIGGHLDSWDQGTGAIDDGAGVAIVMATARAIIAAHQPLARTVRVVLFGAEETDFSGAAYLKAHQDDVPAMALAAEADFGAAPAYQVRLPAGLAETPFGKALDTHLRNLGAFLSPEPSTFAGSDVEPLEQQGVPTAAISQHGATYFDIHHTPDDTLDKIDPAEIQQVAAVWTAIILPAAMGDVDFHPAKPAVTH